MRKKRERERETEGADSKPCKSVWLFRCRRRAEETAALGAREQWSEYQRDRDIEREGEHKRER